MRAKLSFARRVGPAWFPTKPREGSDFWGWVCEWKDDWSCDQVPDALESLPWLHGTTWTRNLPQAE